MKTARNKTARTISELLPVKELDRHILNFIARGVDRPSGDAEFNRLALRLFRHQFARNLPYQRFCLAQDRRPENVRHWSAIPAVPTTVFKDAALTTLKPAQRVRVFHSSGTTGHRPSRHFHSRSSLALYEAALWPMFESRVLAPVAAVSDRRHGAFHLTVLAPTPGEAPHSSLVHMCETVRRRLGATRSAFVQASTFPSPIFDPRSSAPVLLLGPAFAFVHLLDKIKPLALPPGSRVMETGGYKGRSREVSREELHALIAARLGIPRSAIISEYGMCELSSQFYTKPSTLNPQPSTLFTGPPWTRVQIIDPETGREARDGGRGLIRVFDLANRASVVAIQTEDAGIRRGAGFELIGRAPQAEARGCSLMVTA